MLNSQALVNQLVSVPSRGVRYLNVAFNDEKDEKGETFPSPRGE